MTLQILPVDGIPDIADGDDLAATIHGAAPWLQDGDVVVVTSKIVSKSEGQVAVLPSVPGPERDAAKSEVLAAETARVVAVRGTTRIVATHHGFVMAAGGIDESNIDPGHVVLLPKDPDASARAIRADLRERFGKDVVVIISDTMGRPWRAGLTDVALGLAGMPPLRDYRGEFDGYGHELSITQMSHIDELCGAAELVKGKADKIPVAVIRGLGIVGTPDGPGARSLVRPAETDMFALGTDEARADGLRRAATLGAIHPAAAPRGPIEVAIERAIDAAGVDISWHRGATGVRDAGVRLVPELAHGVPEARGGAAVHVLRCSLAADGYRTDWQERDGAPLGVVEVYA